MSEDDLEDVVNGLLARFRSGAEDRPGSAEVIQLLEKALSEGHDGRTFLMACWFLDVPEISDEIWNWIKAQAVRKEFQAPLFVNVFSVLAEDPDWKIKLFDLLCDSRMWWIFLDVYRMNPKGFYAGLEEMVYRRK